MSAHLLTYWATRKRVECTCAWSRRATGRDAAIQMHRAHVGSAADVGDRTPPRVGRTPFIIPAAEGWS